MKKYIFFLLLSFKSLASDQVNVKDLNFFWDQEAGSISFKEIKIQQKPLTLTSGAQEFEIRAQEELSLTPLPLELSLNKSFPPIKIVKANLIDQKTSISLNAAEIDYQDTTHLQKLDVQCERLSQSSTMDLLDHCLQQGILRLEKLQSFNISSLLTLIAPSDFLGATPDDALEKFSVTFKRQAFSGAFTARSILGVTIRFSGASQRIKSDEEDRLILTLQKAKAGPFSVKDKVLTHLKGLEGESFKVCGERLILVLKNKKNNPQNCPSVQDLD